MTAVMMTMAVLLLLMMMMMAIVFNYCRYYFNYYYEEAARGLKQRLALASAAVCCTLHYHCEQLCNKRTHGEFESSCLSIIVTLNPTSCPKQTDPLLPQQNCLFFSKTAKTTDVTPSLSLTRRFALSSDPRGRRMRRISCIADAAQAECSAFLVQLPSVTSSALGRAHAAVQVQG